MTPHATVTRILMAGAVLLVAAACGPAPDGDADSPGELAVTNAVIIDGLGREPVLDGWWSCEMAASSPQGLLPMFRYLMA